MSSVSFLFAIRALGYVDATAGSKNDGITDILEVGHEVFLEGLMRITATYPEMDVKILLVRPVGYLVVIRGQHFEAGLRSANQGK
jgi:hypothetical protein